MTYLQQELQTRRALRSAPEDYTVSAGAPAAVSLHQASGEAWVFLWSTLVSALYDQTEGREIIVLSFLHHLVRIEGQNLDRIAAEIGQMRLQAVRVGEGSLTGHSETGKTVVANIVVKSVNEVPVAPDLGTLA